MRGIAVTALLLAAAAAAGAGDDPKATRTELANGLRVILRPVEGADTVCLLVAFDIGGDHDPTGRSGLAHFVEHLYVTAAAGETPARTAGEFFRRYPKGSNAQTGDRYTVVATVFPTKDLAAEIRDAAARMGDLRIEESDLERERPRIQEEIAIMFGGVPPIAAQNRARERVRPTPRGGRKGGTAEAIAAISLEEAAGWWKAHYKPCNATLVLAGGFDPEAAAAWFEEAFGNIAGGSPPPAPGEPGEPAAEVVARVEIAPRPGAAPEWVGAALAAPAPADSRYPALLLLGLRLLSPRRAAGQPPPGFAPLDDPSVLTLSAPLGPSGDPESALASLRKTLEQALAPGPAPGEGAQVADGLAFLLGTARLPDDMLAQNPYGLAFGLARRMQLGIDPEDLRARLTAMTEEEFREAAKGLAWEHWRAVHLAPVATAPR
jgi:zinc protease